MSDLVKHCFGCLPEYSEFSMGLCGRISVLREGWSLGDFITGISGSEHQPKHGGESRVVQKDSNLEAEHTKSLNTNYNQGTKMII